MSIIRIEQIEKRKLLKCNPNLYEWEEVVTNKYFLGIKYYSKVYKIYPQESKDTIVRASEGVPLYILEDQQHR